MSSSRVGKAKRAHHEEDGGHASLCPPYFLNTPIGLLGLTFEDDCLVQLEFLYQSKKTNPSNSKPSAAQLQWIKKITSYFEKSQPLSTAKNWRFARGTPFQQKVWQALCEIPLGETLTYGDLAKKLKTSSRAIGMACRTNPLPLIVPCHRVVSATGIGGFSGQLLGKAITLKQWLLSHEGRSL